MLSEDHHVFDNAESLGEGHQLVFVSMDANLCRAIKFCNRE